MVSHYDASLDIQSRMHLECKTGYEIKQNAYEIEGIKDFKLYFVRCTPSLNSSSDIEPMPLAIDSKLQKEILYDVALLSANGNVTRHRKDLRYIVFEAFHSKDFIPLHYIRVGPNDTKVQAFLNWALHFEDMDVIPRYAMNAVDLAYYKRRAFMVGKTEPASHTSFDNHLFY